MPAWRLPARQTGRRLSLRLDRSIIVRRGHRKDRRRHRDCLERWSYRHIRPHIRAHAWSKHRGHDSSRTAHRGAPAPRKGRIRSVRKRLPLRATSSRREPHRRCDVDVPSPQSQRTSYRRRIDLSSAERSGERPRSLRLAARGGTRCHGLCRHKRSNHVDQRAGHSRFRLFEGGVDWSLRRGAGPRRGP